MDTKYNHKEFEDKIYGEWAKSDAFKPNLSKKTFSIIMPPPNANDPLHIGHAMFVAIEDILIRFHRMLGDSTLWLPGTDHAGIETQFVFEKKLAKKEQSRFDFDRETLYKMIWNYVQENSDVAVNQMKKLGASADWSKFKFTLNEDVVKFVQETFIKLFNDKRKLVYKGEKLINFCTKCGTGYSELEVEYIERNSPLYYVKYFFVDKADEYITVATTRPEPIYVDTHLAINPKNKKTQYLKGKKLLNPLTNAIMEIIEDDFVDPNFGTGVVKLTPAHDPNDFEAAIKHNLPIIKAISEDGRMIGKPFEGLKVNYAREEAVKLLNKGGHIEKIDQSYVNRVATCYRCHSVLEPMPRTQFFIKTKPLVKSALKALQAETKVLGAGQEKILKHWLNNIKDWNISRQIVWGIRIPVWYDVEDHEQRVVVSFIDENKKQKQGPLSQWEYKYGFDYICQNLQQLHIPMWEGKNNPNFIASITKPTTKGKWIQETDTFDTWFSSGQWPVVTLKTNGEEIFKKFYPTTVMETGYDILPIWVMRMILLGIYLTNKSPFETVYLHGLVRDDKGRKMSKSIGNVINPLDIVEKYGADALRFALVVSSTPAQDKNVGESTFKAMRNFANKIWNATRFVKEFDGKTHDLGVLNSYKDFTESTALEVKKLLERYKVGNAAELVYKRFWSVFCDIRIESAKKGLLNKEDLYWGLKVYLKLLHPFMPFVTEACWKELGNRSLLISETWPSINDGSKKGF